MNFKKLKKYRGRRAVSPVVATLILIIVAIVGAVAVGLIVSGIGTQTSKNANVSGAGIGAESQLLVGGSTAQFPVLVNIATAFGKTSGVNVNVTQGGGGAGMTGVALGVLNIGAAGSEANIISAQSTFPSANLQAFEVGGSAIVVVTNGNNGTTGYLSDGTTNCYTITQAALKQIYTLGTFGITAGSCSTNNDTLISTNVVAGTTFTAVSRSDLPSGAEDTFYDYAFSSTTSNLATPLAGVTEAGDTGILSYVQSHANTIGFVDLGFAEGAAQGLQVAQKVAIAQISSEAEVVGHIDAKAVLCTTTGSSNCATPIGGTTASLHSFIGKSLSTATPSTSAPVYPDVTSSTTTPATGLTRTFWLVTAGAPDTTEQQFITFVQSPANQGFWNQQGYFSLYQITPITPP